MKIESNNCKIKIGNLEVCMLSGTSICMLVPFTTSNNYGYETTCSYFSTIDDPPYNYDNSWNHLEKDKVPYKPKKIKKKVVKVKLVKPGERYVDF